MSVDAGYQSFLDLLSDFEAMNTHIQSVVARVATATLVQVQACTNNGGLSQFGFVDILPLVNILNGAGIATNHKIIYHVPYMRMQGGSNAIIMDPQKGDIGIAVFASRDISVVKATQAQSNPGSRRLFDMADALYVGGLLNGVPSQYIRFSTDGIHIVSPTAIEFDAPDVKVVAPTVEINASTSVTVTTPTLTLNGNLQINGTITQAAGSGGGAASLVGPLTVQQAITSTGGDVVANNTTHLLSLIHI